MKYKNRQKRLEMRRNHFETNRDIQDALRKNPGSFTKPGSKNK